jgi:hypothetical protein
MEGFRSILLPAPEAERLVDPLRRAGDPWRERGELAIAELDASGRVVLRPL